MKLEKLIIGTFLSIVEEGTVVGENTVGVAFYPDPEESGESWLSMGCVMDAAPETETEEDTDYCPSASGGYDKEILSTVVRDVLKLSLKAHSEVIHRLVWGVAAPLVEGEAQTPFTVKDRKIRCWIHFQGRAQDGEDRFIAALYGDLRLDAAPKWSKDPTKPAVRFEIVRSTIQSVVPGDV